MSATLQPLRSGLASQAPAGIPRLLAGARSTRGRMDITAHTRWYDAVPRLGRGDLARVTADAQLAGRGGAGFPTARKLEAVGRARRPGFVVVNAMEGEPLSGKDGHLLGLVPHLVLDGAVLAARDVGAKGVIVVVARDRGHSLVSAQRAAAERRDTRRDSLSIDVHAAPPRYVGGEETALVQWLNGGPIRPTFKAQRPFERGVDGRPTLVLNAETAAHLALIARYGAGWFRGVGTAETPGTALVTVSGSVHRHGVAEVAVGAPIATIVEVHEPSTRPIAILAGGFFGGWVPWPAASRLTADPAALRQAGAGFGPGIIGVLGSGCCVVAETARILRYLASESAGQCGPCIHGVAAVAADFAALESGANGAMVLGRLRRRLDLVEGRGACALPDGVRKLGLSVLDGFAEHVHHHIEHGACKAAVPAGFKLPRGPRTEADWR